MERKLPSRKEWQYYEPGGCEGQRKPLLLISLPGVFHCCCPEHTCVTVADPSQTLTSRAQPATLHELGDPKQTQTHAGCRRKTAQKIPDLSSMLSKTWGRRKLLQCLTLSPSHTGEGDTRKWPFPHCGRSLCLFFPHYQGGWSWRQLCF